MINCGLAYSLLVEPGPEVEVHGQFRSFTAVGVPIF